MFGSEDVDLRTLTNPKAGRPPTPPPPVISDGENKTSWAKIKTPHKSSDRESRSSTDGEKSGNSGRDRLGRPRLCSHRSDDFGGRDRRNRNPLRDLDKNERDPEQNIEIIMRQAAEQLNQKQITRDQYNRLIQEVLHMSEDQKLRAAKLKEQEDMIIWERGNFDENMRHRSSPNGPRWNGPWHGPWPPPPPHGRPPFGPPFGPIAPWQRPFPNMRHPGDFPFHGFNPRMPILPPNGPIIMPPLPMPRGPPMNVVNGATQNPQQQLQQETNNRNSPANVDNGNCDNANNGNSDNNVGVGGLSGGELPAANVQMLEEIAKDSMKSINIDQALREIRYYGDTGVVFMNWDDPRDIGFQNGQRRILIDDKDTVLCNFNEDYKEFLYEGDVHR